MAVPPFRSSVIDVARVVAGGLLLAAAAAVRWHALVVGTQLLNTGLNGPWYGLAVVTAELVLGAWLVSGIQQDRRRGLAIFWFTAFRALPWSKWHQAKRPAAASAKSMCRPRAAICVVWP